MKILGITYIWHGMPDWERVLADRPEFVIVNPHSGPGEGVLDENGNVKGEPEILALVRRCQARGIKVLGYVPLGYCERNVNQVLDEANRYRLWYSVDGIFWDETPSKTSVSILKFLRNVNGFSRSFKKPGWSVFNPGMKPPVSVLYSFMVALPASIWCTFEGSETDYYSARDLDTKWLMSRQAHIVYGVQLGYVKLVMDSVNVGYGYITSKGLPNPYDTWEGQWYN